MRILHFYKTAFPYSIGGVEQVIHQIASGTSKLGIDTDVLSLTRDPITYTTEVGGYLLHQAKLNFEIASTSFSASAFSRFLQLSRRADVIHYHFPWPFMDLVHFATLVKKPTLVTYHSDIIRQKYMLKLYRPLMRKFLASVDRIVATSPNYMASSDVLRELSDKVSIIPIGLNKFDYPKPTPNRLEYWRRVLPKKFFLFVGVLRYYNGLHILLEAVQELNYPVVIVGSGPKEQALKDQAARLGLHNIHFLGFLPDECKTVLLTLCYGVLFPSHLRSEAFGVSLIEGAIYGKPMISSEIGTGTSFINIQGLTGLTVPPSNPIALRQAMDYLWKHPEVAEKMGKNAEKRYWQYFTAEKMVKSYADLYHGLMKNKALSH